MKEKRNNKKTSQCYLTAYILTVFLFSLIFVSCSDFFKDENTLPAGHGSFTLRLSNNVSRTVMPTAIGLDDFDMLKLEFSPVGGGSNITATVNGYNGSPTINVTVILPAGNYTLTVEAYRTNILAARGTLGTAADPIQIVQNEDVQGTVMLRALLNEGSGLFSWNITINAPAITVDAATMNVYPAGNTTPVEGLANVNLKTTPTGNNKLLASGLYNIVVNIEETESKEIVWYELLHIYSAFESKFTFTFTDAHFHETHYIVTFDYDYDDAVPVQQSVLHGGTIGTMPGNPRTGYQLEGWYTSHNGGGTKYEGTEPIYNNLILYAKWIPNHTLNPDLVIDNYKPVLYVSGAELADGDEITIYLGKTDGTEKADVTITNFADFTANSVKWIVNNHVELLTVNNFWVDSTQFPFNTVGLRLLTVQGIKDGAPYSTTVKVRVIIHPGSGTLADPFLVTSETELRAVGRGTAPYADWALDKHYKLTADIDLTGKPDFTRIDTAVVNDSVVITGGTPFSGTFDGNGHTITGLTVNGAGNLGMFGVIDGSGEVRNLGLINVNIYSTANKFIGGIAGTNKGTIINCFVTGSVTTTGTGATNGANNAGIAATNTGTVKNCYSTVLVNGNMTVGGIVGYNPSPGRVENCVALNTILIARYSGTGAGRIARANEGTLVNNYARSDMLFKTSETDSGSFSFPSHNATLTGKDGADITGAECRSEAWWRLQGFDPEPWPTSRLPLDAMYGTAGDPILIDQSNHVAMFADMRTPAGLTKHYRLTTDITVSGNWTPIGGDSGPNLTGNFDGGGHTITGITINSGGSNRGMFNAISPGGEVRNLGLIDVSISSNISGNLGGIAGGNHGLIENCFVAGNSNIGSSGNTTTHIGGIVGANVDTGIVQNCYSTATVNNASTGNVNFIAAGGIAGANSGKVQNCVVLGSQITGANNVGRAIGVFSYPANVTPTGTGINNYARSDMTVNGSQVTSGTGLTTIHGENITTTNLTAVQAIINTIHAALGTTPPNVGTMLGL